MRAFLGIRQQNPDPAPPSLSAGGYEMHDYYAAQDATRPDSQQEPTLTPYLGLRARLSQTWINRWTVLLLLVLVRTLFAIASLDNSVAHAKKEALSACTSVENVGSAMASMPYYLSTGVNDLMAKSVEMAISALMDLLLLLITGVEDIVLFIINMMTSTYLCLITMAVGGTLHAGIEVAEFVGSGINTTIQGVASELNNMASSFESELTKFIDEINQLVGSPIGQTIQPPSLDLSSEISKLSGLQLPAGYDTNLITLNNSIPTFAQVKNATEFAIQWPFEEVKKLLNESLPNYTIDATLFPVPPKQQLTFCSDNDGIESFFLDLVELEHTAQKVFLGVIIVCAILAMVPMAWREMRQYRFMKDRARLVKSDAFDPMDAVYIASRPYTSLAGLKLAERVQSSRRKALIRWAVAYATTVPALFVLSLALAGLLGCLCQYILLKAIEKEVPILENDVIGFADKVINSLNNASESWAIGTNHIINDTNAKINSDVFSWVNTTTTAVNHTLEVFVDDMINVLNITFGGTVLYTPILDVLNCLVLLKVQGIENGLTWVKDHAYVDFPTISDNVFSLGTIDKVSGSPSDILNTGANGGAADAITGAMNDVISFAEKTIRQEAIIASCLLIVWLIIAFVGIGRAIFLMYKGGDDDTGVFIQPLPMPKPPSIVTTQSTDKRDLDALFTHGAVQVPTYEQATQEPVSTSDNAANKYNGQSYTLTPRPLPNIEVNNNLSPRMSTGFSPRNETIGSVGGSAVDAAIRRPTHIRSSSHGDLQVTTPASPRARNPFNDPRYLSPDDNMI